MLLEYPKELVFSDMDAAKAVPPEAVDYFCGLLKRISRAATEQKSILETLKHHFASSVGQDWSPSSNAHWAGVDLLADMQQAAQNAVTFVDALWTSIDYCRQQSLVVPTQTQINAQLRRFDIALAIQGTELLPVQRTDPALEPGQPSLQSDLGTFSRSLSNGYTLRDEIGSGGFGVVRRATRHTPLGEFEFALKSFNPSSFCSDTEKARARFAREIQAIQSLQHNGIVTYVDAGIGSDGHFFLVMHLIKGVDFRTAASGYNLAQKLQLTCLVLDALDYAHRNGVIHRDLKPRNIVVRESDGQPVILDFGNAYLFDDISSESLTTTMVGSLGYIPPELIANPKLRTVLHDIYSVGVILYEVFAGKLPDVTDYSPLVLIDQNLAAIDSIIRRALAPARKRISSAQEFSDLLRLAMVGS